MKRILIVDDHELIRRGVRSLLLNSNYAVCGEASTGIEAVDSAVYLKPDVVLLDVSMPGMTGVEALHRIRRLAPSTKVIFFTMHSPESLRNTGVDAAISKDSNSDTLLAAIEQVLAGSQGS